MLGKNKKIVARQKNYFVQLKIKRKRNIKKITAGSAGSVNVALVAATCFFLSCLFYLFSINNNAMKGQEIRLIEKEIADLRAENKQLLIKEAEAASFYRIEEASRKFGMSELKDVVFIEENNSVAFK